MLHNTVVSSIYAFMMSYTLIIVCCKYCNNLVPVLMEALIEENNILPFVHAEVVLFMRFEMYFWNINLCPLNLWRGLFYCLASKLTPLAVHECTDVE